jgi:hypothetical protein
MADIILAEFNGSVWLVGGEDHVDDLLGNTLPNHLTIEFVACESKPEVHALWEELSGTAQASGDPWVIHPGIVARIRRAGAPDAVQFAPWSAALEPVALILLDATARYAGGDPLATVLLAAYPDPAGPPMLADIARLRVQLIEQKLVEFGLARDRISHTIGDPADPEAGDRIDIVVRPG